MIQRRDLNQSKIDKLWEENEGFDFTCTNLGNGKAQVGVFGGDVQKDPSLVSLFPSVCKIPKKVGVHFMDRLSYNFPRRVQIS